jgi:O-antigen/teichoic acid export membrane protein
MLGSESVGFLNWALETAFFPLTFVDIIVRVGFPLMSRLQSDPPQFAVALERSLRISVVIALGLSSIFLGLSSDLTEIIYSAQWLPAVGMLEVYAAVISVGILVNAFTPAFDAVGKPRVVLAQMILVTVATWLLAPLGGHLRGNEGFAFGYAGAMALGAVVIVLAARRELPRVPIVRAYAAPAVGAAASIALGRLLLGPWVEGPVSLAVAVVAEVLAFLTVMAVLDRHTLLTLRTQLRGESAHREPASPDTRPPAGSEGTS